MRPENIQDAVIRLAGKFFRTESRPQARFSRDWPDAATTTS